MKFKKFFASNRAFYCIVGLLAFQALWISFSNRYPMAFDEEYHFGLIKFYSHHLSPFLGSQPTSADAYGALIRDPSYLYHYLLSFPYRLLAAITDSQSVQIIALRCLNILFFASGLFVFKRLLDTIGKSPALSNYALLIFVLIPVVPLLAGQINYDNVFIPLVGLLLLLIVQAMQELKQTRALPLRELILIVTTGLYGSLIKYPFLPFFVASIVCIVAGAVIYGKSVRSVTSHLLYDARKLRRSFQVLAVSCLVVGLGLFSQRYLVNAVKYHSPIPDCSSVLSEKRCAAYGPWLRDYTLAKSANKSVGNAAVYFFTEWLYGMWFRLFFMVDGPATHNETHGPLFFPATSAVVFGLASLIVIGMSGQYLYRRYGASLLAPLMISTFYVLLLFIDGYAAYRRTGQPVAVNGRYLLPILPLVTLSALLAWQHTLQLRPKLKDSLAIAAVICLVWGGGVLTFILRTNDYWYWNNTVVRHVNYTVRHTLGPVTPGYTLPTLFLH